MTSQRVCDDTEQESGRGRRCEAGGERWGNDDMQFQVDALKPASAAKVSMGVWVSACGCRLSSGSPAEQMPAPLMSSLAVRTVTLLTKRE